MFGSERGLARRQATATYELRSGPFCQLAVAYCGIAGHRVVWWGFERGGEGCLLGDGGVYNIFGGNLECHGI